MAVDAARNHPHLFGAVLLGSSRSRGSPRDFRAASGWSHGDCGAVKFGEGKTSKGLVVRLALVAQDANRDRLAEQQSLLRIRAPVHSGHVTAQCDIVGYLIEFADHRD